MVPGSKVGAIGAGNVINESNMSQSMLSHHSGGAGIPMNAHGGTATSNYNLMRHRSGSLQDSQLMT